MKMLMAPCAKKFHRSAKSTGVESPCTGQFAAAVTYVLAIGTKNWQILKTLGSVDETLNLSLMTHRTEHTLYAYYSTIYYEHTSPRVHPGLP